MLSSEEKEMTLKKKYWVLHIFLPCNMYLAVPWLEISIDGCRIWPIAEKVRQKSVKEVSGLKIDGCMHQLPKIDGCSCTYHICCNQVPCLVFEAKKGEKI